jgi:hypothetical protein
MYISDILQFTEKPREKRKPRCVYARTRAKLEQVQKAFESRKTEGGRYEHV